ncbi:P-loop containing nucleoside triphosphate hydrolase protein [Stereum hirsutum FP-91666 SS1]|uniref:P-loop containing nucleoside triphosphate hydrolase protein n=1 Tax=Stereum hirsutum (strain FP-91666) TaxID=721885 RepID=UPI000444993B|nr:P-loop containing nucleoside triphosphate hydrolase protein [Stereum hirsutum FP-91666 SS1]EIM83035.1 P-loop containing nucleoside triphosphate hydrolase protein [Stereum hirsutum FP-91666 SS1]
MSSKKVAQTSSASINATSEQSRFHTETLNTSVAEIDLKGVSITIGQCELIADSRLKLKEGVRYALVGRNGTGKSTLLQAVSQKLIPGISTAVRILLVSQVEDTSDALEDINRDASVLIHVVRGDKERTEAMKEFEALTKAVEAASVSETQRIVSEIRLERLRRELQEARKIASRTSGTRGKKAREEEIKAEERVQDAETKLAEPTVELDIAARAAEMLNDVSTTLELLDASTTEARAATILNGLGFTKSMIDSPFSSLSGGWRSRCALATSLLVQSDILMLDEPSNFLDLEATLWLEQYLISQDRTLVLTSHDQVFLNNVVDGTIILRDKTLLYFEGTPRAFDIDERKKRKAAVKAQDALDKKKEHIETSIRKGKASAKQTGDENRLRMVKSRQKKLDERWGAETSAKGTRFKLNRDLAGYHLTNRGEIAIEEGEAKVKIAIHSPEKLRTAGSLVHCENVSFRYPKAAKATLEGVTFTVDQGGRCAFVGANGQGKSTLAKLILGELSPTKGSIVRHPTLKIGYFSQHSVEELSRDLKQTALGYFLDHFEKKGDKVTEMEARSCLGTLGLGGKIASDTPLGALSGGQKVRLAFALIVHRPPSLLLLDEVTTHVDAPTIQAIAVALQKFTGGIILVTHDRWFSRVVVEGCSLASAGAFGEDEEDPDDISDASSDDDDDGNHAGNRGQTYYVGIGTIKLLENGMKQYVEMVERRLRKKQRAEEVQGRKPGG